MHVFLGIPRGLVGPWRRLSPAVRWYLGAFLRGRGADARYLAPDFVARQDFESTGRDRGEVEMLVAGMSIAFPRMARRIIGIEVTDTVLVNLACEGHHEGMWHGVVAPTGRRVRFEEEHDLTLRGGRIAVDRTAMSFHSIFLQLSGDEAADVGPAHTRSLDAYGCGGTR